MDSSENVELPTIEEDGKQAELQLEPLAEPHAETQVVPELKRRHNIQAKCSQLDELEEFLEKRQDDCYKKHEQLLELDENLDELRAELEGKEKELMLREQVAEFMSAGYDLHDLVIKKRENETRIKKLISDMYRVQEKLANAQYQLIAKDREILNLKLQIRKLTEKMKTSSESTSKDVFDCKQLSEDSSRQCGLTPTVEGAVGLPFRNSLLPIAEVEHEQVRSARVTRATSLDSSTRSDGGRQRAGSVVVTRRRGGEEERVHGRRQTIAMGMLDGVEETGVGRKRTEVMAEAQLSKACIIQ